MRDRRRSRLALRPPNICDLSQLQDWMTKSGSSILYLDDPRLRSEEARDVAMDLIQALDAVNIKAIWHLAPSTGQTISSTDIIRSFIHQLMSQSGTKTNGLAKSLCAAQLSKSMDDYLAALYLALSRIPRIVIVIDTRGTALEIFDTIDRFWKMAGEQNATRMKVLILTYGSENSPLISRPVETQIFSINLGSAYRIRFDRCSPRSKTPRAGRLQTRHNMGIGDLASILRQHAVEEQK